MKIAYSEQVRRNAQHLIKLGQAVLDGKPIWHHSGPAKQRVWERMSSSSVLFQNVYRTYTATPPENRQMALEPRDAAARAMLEHMWRNGSPVERRYRAPNHGWVLIKTYHDGHCWDWHSFEYRLAVLPAKSEPPHTEQRQLFDVPEIVASPEVVAAAYAGKTIEYRFRHKQTEWYTVTHPRHTPEYWSVQAEYRIKPEPPAPQCRHWTLEEVPVGSVVCLKHLPKQRILILFAGETIYPYVLLSNEPHRAIPCSVLLDYYVRDDGTPCGVRVT